LAEPFSKEIELKELTPDSYEKYPIDRWGIDSLCSEKRSKLDSDISKRKKQQVLILLLLRFDS